MLTRRAIGNLINRYNAVLKKCRLLNVFGSLAAAALLVGGVCSVSSAAVERGSITTTTDINTDTTVTATKTMNDAVVGIYGGSSQSLSLGIANVTLTVKNSADSNVSCFYGVAATTGSLITIYQDTDAANAKLNIELEAADGQDAILFSTTGARLTVYPIVNATVKGGSSGNVIGVEAASGSKIDFKGTETLLNVISNGGNAFGVYNYQTSYSSEIGFSSPNTSIEVQNSTDSTGVTKGVMAYQSQTSFTGNNTNISVQGGRGDTFGIHLISDTDGSDTQVSFSRGTTVIDVTGTETTYGVSASGSSGSVGFAGESATVKVSSSEGTAEGLVSQNGAHITASTAMDIEVQTSSGDAYGLYSDGEYTKNTFSGDTSISVSSTGGNFLRCGGDDGQHHGYGRGQHSRVPG